MKAMDLNGQTAPESTHGLFGAPPELKLDKRRSAIEQSNASSILEGTPHAPRSQSVYGTLSSTSSPSNTTIISNSNNNNRLSQHRSALHTVNEEETSRSSDHILESNTHRSSVANFNESPIGHHQYQQQQQQKRRSTSANGTLQDYRRYSSGTTTINEYTKGDDEQQQQQPRRMSRADALAEAEAKLNGYRYTSTSTTSVDQSLSSRRASLRPFQPACKPNMVVDDFPEKQNRRLSEPNARAYHRHSDNYSPYQQDQQDYQRRSFNISSSSNQHTNGHSHYNNNKRTSLQLSSPSSFGTNNADHGDRRAGSKPTHLFVDVSNENRRSRNFNNDWRSSTSSLGNNSNGNNESRSSNNNRSSVYGFVPFTPTRMSFSREDNTIQQQLQQRRALFTAHLPFSAVAPHLKSHQLVSGMLRVNKRNRSDAYVFCEPFNADIYICGSRDRNRALEGDHVAIRLVEVDRVLREKLEKEEAKLARNNGQPVIRKPDEEDEKEIIFGGEDDVEHVKPRYCGVVTAILERVQNQMFSGTLGLMRPSNKRQQKRENDDEKDTSPRIVWFKPTDKRVPLIAIPVEQAPAGFIENSQAFENILFLGSIKRWPITSLHPFGVLETELGSVDKLNVQFRAILADNNFLNDGFTDEVIQCLPSLPWSPPKEEFAVRRDLRSNRSITLTNMKKDDHDIAISFEKLGNESYQVGFHVADFTAFVKPQSPIDKEARDRASGIYLYQSVPLWPEDLLKQCTDLVPDKDRFAFSVVWKFNSNNQVIDTWYGKTIIRSQVIMTPKEIQDILDNDGDDDDNKCSTTQENDLTKSNKEQLLARDLKSLYDLSQFLKNKRLKEGALFLSGTKLDIDMVNDTPVHISAEIEYSARDILQEFKILANTGVAQKITRGFPESALLLSQSAANERKLQELTTYLRGLGYMIDPSSAQTLQSSVSAIDNPDAKSVITTLVLKTMRPIKYFCTGSFDISRYHHYSMNLPLYTEFTSPSRKYASLMVHRQLESTLAGEKRFYLDHEYIQKIAQHCNAKEQSIINAGEQAQHLLLSKYLTSTRQTSMTHEAIVVGVQEQAFDVIVPSLGLERRIHVMNLPLRTSHYSPLEGVLNLFWLPGVPTSDAMVEQPDDDRGEDEDDYSVIEDEQDTTGNDQMVHRLSVSESSTKRRPRSMSLRAVDGESLTSQQQCTIPQECCLVVRPFDFIRVVITADSIRNPPLIRVLAANPFVHHDH
ncbi:uncharacterized protein BX664DRAFT_290910 [Halteromyces radiatus]|uniref:uncharacterized protein n=1 Tax=Halteromyces radiatus TaxID=101107 RepID=UPI00221E6C0B|nr:uncharacterized protein BX664DRAFT_290910 [Halteromyces radiatus]KAI8096174.1 hypothetical protein BX664DRAFT_290910 [Halteromyces radiatus]